MHPETKLEIFVEVYWWSSEESGGRTELEKVLIKNRKYHSPFLLFGQINSLSK